MSARVSVIAIMLLSLTVSASAQFNVLAGQWGKLDSSHVRVMTYNIEDAICSSGFKGEGANSWCALARIVAINQPDILILQEAGDNNGNGTGSGVDSQATLHTLCRLFFAGGADPFRGGTVTAYVQKYSENPGYDLPYIFVSAGNDGFNRNIILSRWPFADLNGDGVSQYSDIYNVAFNAGGYASGGNGGIRGFAFAEIDLPDTQYEGDVVIGNTHLKAGGGASNETQRCNAARNVAFFIEHFFNGAGTGSVDPTGSISDFPVPFTVLPDHTPVVIGGDWNQDSNVPLSNPGNLKPPARWLVEAAAATGVDGTDRDRSNMTYDSAFRKTISFNGTVVDGSPATNSAGKLDHIAHQDSIVAVANQFIFDSFELIPSAFPPPMASYPGNPYYLTRDATDHQPVVVDFIFAPPAPVGCVGDANADLVIDSADLSVLLGQFGQPVTAGSSADFNADGVVDAADLSVLLASFDSAC